MLSPLSLILFFITLAAALLTAYALWRLRSDASSERFRWLMASLCAGLLTVALHVLPPDLMLMEGYGRDLLIWMSMILFQIAFAGYVLDDITRQTPQPRLRQFFIAINAVWAGGFLLTLLAQPVAFSGWEAWVDQTPAPAAFVAIGGSILLGSMVLGMSFYYFYIAPMPELANRFAFYAALQSVLLIDYAIISSGSSVLAIPGTIILALLNGGLLYTYMFHRLMDVRRSMMIGLRVLVITVVTWSIIFSVLYAMAVITLPAGIVTLVITGSIALIVALLLIPVRQTIELIYRQIVQRVRPPLARAIAAYTRRVAFASTLEEVVNATTDTLNDVMQVRRSALILINTTYRVPDSVELVVLEGGSSLSDPAHRGFISRRSPVYHTLAVTRVPLTQFDIEYSPAYRQLHTDERDFFRQLLMRAYVPIVTDNRLIGLLACGPRLNDMPYYRDDMEMLMVIGQQVGTALRGARLIDDLQHLNTSMRALNKRLENAKSELEKLDSIKTDFVTIASHELRTPLAQIRGYTDIIDSMNEQGLLKREQTDQMVASLRKSTERMGELISAMLDVSQLDVNAMDLRFIRTTPDTVVRMAIDPLSDALEQRNLTIKHDGLKNLPYLQADMQRLVQAFRNLIQNAIKFTPDGGEIEITGKVEASDTEDSVDHILFAIRDSGVGIAAKDLDLIFQKFYRAFDTQLHSSGSYKFMGAGPGLGLTIARGIVDGHGGKIWAESPGHDMEALPGATIYIRLPVSPPEGVRRVLPFQDHDIPAERQRTSELKKLTDNDVATADDKSTSASTSENDSTTISQQEIIAE